MGIFDEVKRLLWVKKAVAKSAAEKAADKVDDFSDELADKASDAWEKGKDIAEDLGEKIVTKTREGLHEAKETVSNLFDKKDDWNPVTPEDQVKEDSAAFKAGEKIGETAAKVGDTAEKVWDKAKEEGKEILDKAVEVSDKTWEKAEEVGKDVWEKAKSVAEKAGQKIEEGLDSMLEKAKELDKTIEAERDKIDANRDGWADTTIHDKLKEQGSTLKDKDDFFSKAERFAEGDYSMGKPVVTIDDTGTDDPMPPLPKEDFDEAILDEGEE